MIKFPSLLSNFWLQWQGKATHRNACRFAASAHVHRLSNGFKWYLWASWGSLTPFSLLHVLNRIEPRQHAHLCGSSRSNWFWASETSLHTSTYRMEAICICSSGMDNRRASGFFGWTTLDHLSGVFIDPSLRSLVLDPASPASPREVKVSLDVLRTILWRFAASGQQHCQASIEAISNTGGTSQEFPQSFAGDLQLADVATGRGLMWGYDVGSTHHLAFPRIWGKNHC